MASDAELDELAALISAGSENQEVEYKSWMDTTSAEAKAEIAKDLAALANHGGGYLVFGVDDERKPQGPGAYDLASFGEEPLTDIVRTYLDPPFQVRVRLVPHGGHEYPVAIVPSHGARPVIPKRNGPDVGKGKIAGVRLGTIYIRGPLPESAPIARPDDWNALFDRCLRHRADLLAGVMRRAIDKPSKTTPRVRTLLAAACDSVADDFARQMASLTVTGPDSAKDTALAKSMGKAFATVGYALVGDDGDLIGFDDAAAANRGVSSAHLELAWRDGSVFYPHVQGGQQAREWTVAGERLSGIEGLRPERAAYFTADVGYWRIYDVGLACQAKAYVVDYIARHGRFPASAMRLSDCLEMLHGVLAHARLVAERDVGVARAVVRMDWRGLAGRRLFYDEHSSVSPAPSSGDQTKTAEFAVADLKERYFDCLARLAGSFLEAFAAPGWLDPDQFVTVELIQQEFARNRGRMRLFPD
jgi:hypothetical protein